MIDKRATTPWAVVSLVCSILACIVDVALPAIYSNGLHQEPTGVSAGLAVMFFGLLSITLSLLGVIFGIVALRKIRRVKCGGRGMAWTGIILGSLPLIVLVGYLGYSIPAMWNALWQWIDNLNRGRGKQ